MLERFIANAIKLSIEHPQLHSFNINFLKFEEVAANNQVLEFIFNKNTLLSIIELLILYQLEK